MEQIVFITGYGDIPMGIGAMKRGAVDFLSIPSGDGELLSAVAQALARSAEDWQKRGEVVENRAWLAKLTPREFEVFRLVIAGLLNKEIGAELGVALRTIKTHRGRVMQKMGVLSVAGYEAISMWSAKVRPLEVRWRRGSVCCTASFSACSLRQAKFPIIYIELRSTTKLQHIRQDSLTTFSLPGPYISSTALKEIFAVRVNSKHLKVVSSRLPSFPRAVRIKPTKNPLTPQT